MPCSASASVATTRARGQHVGGAAGHRQRLVVAEHVVVTRRHQHQFVEAHHLDRARGGAHVAGVAGVDEHEAGDGREGGRHGRVKCLTSGLRLQPGAVQIVAARSFSSADRSPAPLCPLDRLPHVASAPPDAQHRRQGGPRSRIDHQPRRARRRTAAGHEPRASTTSSPRSTRRPSRPSSKPCSPPTPAMPSSPKSRAASMAPSTASTCGSSIRSTAPPTSSTACRCTPCRSRWRFAARSSRPSSTTRRATTCSSPARAAARSSTTGACACPSASASPRR